MVGLRAGVDGGPSGSPPYVRAEMCSAISAVLQRQQESAGGEICTLKYPLPFIAWVWEQSIFRAAGDKIMSAVLMIPAQDSTLPTRAGTW